MLVLEIQITRVKSPNEGGNEREISCSATPGSYTELFPTTSPGCDTRTVVKQSTVGLNLNFFFFYSGCPTKAKEPSLPYYSPITGERRNGFMFFQVKGHSFVQDLNSGSYVVYSINFQTFLVEAFKIVVDSWKFTMFLLFILWDDWLIFMVSCSNEQLQQQLEYTRLKPDCHSGWISKIQSGRKDTLEERYAIKFCFKLGKNATKTYGMLQTAFGASCMNRASVFEWHKRFKKGRESVSDDERCERSKEVNRQELIGPRR